MDFIDPRKDITRQVEFNGHILSLMLAEANEAGDAESGDEDATCIDAHGCGNCISLTIFYGDREIKGILLTKESALQLAEFLTATANL